MLSDQAELDVETNRYWEAWIRPDGEGETEWPRVTLEESPLQVAGKWVPPPVDSSPNRLALPSPSQIRWHDLELGMFCHFGLNTYTEREWGDGTDPPSLFHPEQFDARQWVRVAKRAGFRYLVLTAKHHDGFCLWPTRTTDYSVRSSPWRNGNGDVVKEVAEACREEGLLFGLYLSPWDRHAPSYRDQAAYDDMYAEQPYGAADGLRTNCRDLVRRCRLGRQDLRLGAFHGADDPISAGSDAGEHGEADGSLDRQRTGCRTVPVLEHDGIEASARRLGMGSGGM